MKIFKGSDGMPQRADRESSVAISGPSSVSDTPRRRRICDISKKSRRCRFEMLIKTRILHVQTARSLRRAANKPKAASTSQAYFKIDVPKWSDYFSMDSSCNVSATPLPSSDPVPDLDEPIPKRLRLDASQKKSRRDRFEMLIQKRALRVQALRCSRRADDKHKTPSTSQAYFQIIVPKWSDYFVDSPSDVFGTWPLPEKKICSTQSAFHQVQTPDRSPSSDTSQHSDEDRSEKMEPVPTNRSTPLPSSVCIDPASDLDDPSAKRRRVDASMEIPTEKIHKKTLLRRLARPTRHSPSDEKTISSAQSQEAEGRPKNLKPLAPKPGPVFFLKPHPSNLDLPHSRSKCNVLCRLTMESADD